MVEDARGHAHPQRLRRLLAEAFSEDQVAVVGEELLDPGEFTALPFDHIVFTARLARRDWAAP
ncbi:MAG: hypothetical protein U1E77_00480 [Inhella sp.]